MNINSRPRIFIYLAFLFLLAYLLFKEYTYIRSYKDSGILYSFSSATIIFTWWVLIIGSVILTIPLLKKQKIGYLGLLLLLAVLIKPIIQPKFPEETAGQFYLARKVALKQLVKKYPNQLDRKIMALDIKKLDFEELHIVEGNHFFLVWDENYPYPYGICYGKRGDLPSEILGSPIEYKELEKNWYEFDHTN